MTRKNFIKTSSTLAAAPLLSPLAGFAQQEKLKNWAGNIEFSTSNVFYPKSVDEVVSLVKKLNKIRGLGTKHCFNRIADSSDNLISSYALNKIISIDEKAHSVTVEAGIKYGELAPYLHEKGFALHNLASLPHISVAGSCATATHGSGVGNGNLSTAVNAMEFVTANGDMVHLSRAKDGENFLGAVVALGAFGIVTKMGLDIQPTYMVKQYVFERLPLSQLQTNFEKIISAGYSVSLFTDWQNDSINEVWIKSRVDSGVDYPAEFYGAKAATKNIHPIADISAENCTEQMGVAGAWHERLPHFKMGFTPSSGVELQSEYFVPRKHGLEAFLAISKLGAQIGPHLFISEIRTIEADDLWMSPCYKQACTSIHFTWKQDWPAVSKLLPLIESTLAPFDARPHWGKLFSISPDVLRSKYPKLEEFKKLVASYDPKGKFRNEFLNKNLYA